MSFWLESDTLHTDPRFAVLAEGRRGLSRNDLIAAYCCLMSLASHHRSNGWLTAADALEQCGRKQIIVDLLASRPLADRPPMLHTKGDECECFTEWVDGYTYLLHWFLKKNPHKRETERAKKQEAERKHPTHRARVYERDGGRCRYCRTGRLHKSGMGNSKDRRRIIHYDHVDPDALAGPDLANLVVSCARCNGEKQHRTPDEADMLLLPEPTPEEREEWLSEEFELHMLDRPPFVRGQRRDSAVDSDGTAISTAVDTAVHTPVPTAVPALSPEAVSTGVVRPETGAEQPGQRVDPVSEVGGWGGVGQPRPVSSESQPYRSADAPDIYHGRSRDRPPTDPRCTVCRLPINPQEGTTHSGCEPDPTGWPAGARPRPPPP